MDRGYWNKYYKNNKGVNEPSPFAVECLSTEQVRHGDTLLELGHGNGRDSLWFHKHGVAVCGVDQSGVIDSDDNLALERLDFTDSKAMSLRFSGMKFDHVYSRFSWHSVSEPYEDDVLDWIPDLLSSPSGMLLIECRTIYDELCSETNGALMTAPYTFQYEDGHQRRFIDPGKLIGKLLKRGYEIECADMSCEFAPLGDESPLVLRIEARLK